MNKKFVNRKFYPDQAIGEMNLKTGEMTSSKNIYDQLNPGLWAEGLFVSARRTRRTRIHKKQKQKFRLLLSNLDFQKRIKKLRENFYIPQEGFKEFDTTIKWAGSKLSDLSTLKRYEKSYQKILDEFNISYRWEPVMDYYILSNREDVDNLLPLPIDIAPLDKPNRLLGIEKFNKNELILEIQIFKDSTLLDVTQCWSEIKGLQPLLSNSTSHAYKLNKKAPEISILGRKKSMKIANTKAKKFLSYKLIEKYLRIEELDRDGYTCTQIAKKVGLGREYSRISTYLDRLKTAQKGNILE